MADEQGPTIFDASPLIFFARAGHIGLIEVLPRPLLVPEAVASEIRSRGESDVTYQAIESSEFKIAPTAPVPPSVAQWGLGPGESAAISLASQHSGSTVVIDDLAGRRCAAALGLRLRGTLGIVLLCKRRGIIPAARPILEDMLRGGLYLSRSVLDRALRRVGE